MESRFGQNVDRTRDPPPRGNQDPVSGVQAKPVDGKPKRDVHQPTMVTPTPIYIQATLTDICTCSLSTNSGFRHSMSTVTPQPLERCPQSHHNHCAPKHIWDGISRHEHCCDFVGHSLPDVLIVIQYLSLSWHALFRFHWYLHSSFTSVPFPFFFCPLVLNCPKGFVKLVLVPPRFFPGLWWVPSS